MLRFPTTKRRYLKPTLLALLVTAHVAVMTTNYFHSRRTAQVNAVLSDPLTSAITPSQFGLEVASTESARSGDDQWKSYCYRARASLVEQARIASAETSRN